MASTRPFNLLIVHGNGTRIRRLDLPPWTLAAAASAFLLTLVTSVALFGAYRSVTTRYATLQEQSRQVVATRQRADEQQQIIESVRRRLKDIQAEAAAWREVHDRIAAAIGPEAAAGRKAGTGIGGPSRPSESPESLSGEIDRLFVSVSEEGQRLQALERISARASKLLAAIPSRWPVRGAVNSEFGRRVSPWNGAVEFHGGLDIAAGSGTPVRAPAAGTVLFAGPGGDYGNEVKIDHGHELTTLFGHLQRIDVTTGQHVERGQQIALTGNTGRSTGPHLHYEVQVKKQAVNPRAYLWN